MAQQKVMVPIMSKQLGRQKLLTDEERQIKIRRRIQDMEREKETNKLPLPTRIAILEKEYQKMNQRNHELVFYKRSKAFN